MTDFVIKAASAPQRPSPPESFDIRWPNVTRDVSEAVARVGGVMADLAVTRPGKLRILPHGFIQLTFENQLGADEIIDGFAVSSIKRSTYQENALPRSKQLARPAVSGGIVGALIAAIVLYQTWDERSVSGLGLVLAIAGLIGTVAVIFIAVALFRSPGNLTGVTFVFSDQKVIAFGVALDELPHLLESLKRQGIEIERMPET